MTASTWLANEAAAIGSMLWDDNGDVTRSILSKLTPEMFVDPRNRDIYAACEAVYRRDHSLDGLMLRTELTARGQMEAIGLEYLTKVFESVPSAANGIYYAREVYDAWRKRQVGQAVHSMGQVVADEPHVDAAIDLVQSIAQTIRPDRRESLDKPSVRLLRTLDDTASGKLRPCPLPWAQTHRLTYALLPETVTLLCGGLGASKSFGLLQIMHHLSESKVLMCIYELEESQDFHLRRYAAQVSGCPGLTNPDWIAENHEQAKAAADSVAGQVDDIAPHVWASPTVQPTLSQVARWVADRARDGYRVIAVDPVTAAAHTSKSQWEEDNTFLSDVKRTAVDCQCSVLLVTHPTKFVGAPDVNSLAGSAAFARFSQTILWLEAHNQPKSGQIKTPCGTIASDYNRTLHVLKARNSVGQGVRVACNFDPATLGLAEIGLVVKEDKHDSD